MGEESITNQTGLMGNLAYDEDPDEAFGGPAVLREYEDEYYDDEYEEESQALIEATMEGTDPSRSSLLIGQHILWDHTQLGAVPGSAPSDCIALPGTAPS